MMTDPGLDQLAAEYRSGRITRRACIERLISIVGSAALAQRYLESSGWAGAPGSLQSDGLPQKSGQEAESPGVESCDVIYPAEGATLLGYLSRPQPDQHGKPFPGLLLIHENLGLSEHIRDVTRRLAAEGYLVLAVDQLSRQGGTASFLSPEDAAGACGNVSDEDVVRDLEAATSYLVSHRLVRPDRIGVMGFGWGGERAFLYAAVNPALKAAVVFYGSPPPEDKLAAVEPPVLGTYAGNDTRVTSTVAAIQAAMQRLGKSFDARIYPAVEHGFFNNTGPHYEEAAAQDAWTRTLTFLKKHLASESA
jgi:carboxymethylenebutenolidase